MAEVPDGYDAYYAERLWQLIPAVYRARDSDDPSVTGPLEELLRRIGAQVAVVRRSIDRLWADQSSRRATTGSSRTSATCSTRT